MNIGTLFKLMEIYETRHCAHLGRSYAPPKKE